MKNFIKFTATLSILSTILFACGESTPTALTTAAGAASGICTSNSNCPSGQTCNVAWGTCVSSNPADLCAGVTCTVSNQTCNAATGICVTNAGCTSGSVTCSTGQYCEQDTASANYGTCQTPKVNGQPCSESNNGADCATSDATYKTCDFIVDSLCGIAWSATPITPCDSHAQCRVESNGMPQYCDLNCDTGSPNTCWGTKAPGYVCKDNYQF